MTCPIFFGQITLAVEKDEMPPGLSEGIMRGMEGIYSIQFSTADTEFQKIADKYPDRPYGYFGKAITTWARLEYEEEESNPELDKLFQQFTDTALEKGRLWIKKHPNDANAHMCLGGMYGLRARLSLMQHKWIKSYFEGRNAISHTRKAVKLNPELYDAYLGLGMYEYYAGTLPGAVRILAKLFMNGSPEKGIAYITTCKDKGHFNATAAKLMLIEIFTQTGSKYADPQTAMLWSKELRETYPQHPMIHFVEIVSLYENGKWGDVRREAQDYLRKIETKKHLYKDIYLPRALLAVGTSFLAEHDFDKAEEVFARSARTLESAAIANRWAVWAVVRLGQIYDLKGNREMALKTYRQALSYKDEWGFKDYIKEFLSRAYTAEEIPGQLPPP